MDDLPLERIFQDKILWETCPTLQTPLILLDFCLLAVCYVHRGESLDSTYPLA